MRLAEALALRADAARRVEQLRARIAGSARYQEGETPAEDATALLAEVGEVLDELETLIRRINRTNAAIQVEGGTLTDALARRDVLRLRHGLLTSAASAAAGDGQRGYRQLRSELKMIPALPVAEIRRQADDLARQADDLARQVRDVDTLIQRVNWEVELLD
ncbi:DIP1984 family protein [Actinoplanes sp. G11-F43]|uniref:DIP1984 family protein n=1 Tax=Actinoplanes sp. G11-F43 TaxID=3424130 RepID=UPI003D341BCE